MIRVALKGIAARKLRTVLTALAIVLGVSMVAGAYTLTDTMRGAADSLSSSAYDSTDAVVSAETAFGAGDNTAVQRPVVPASTVDQVRSVPGVGVAIGDITDEARIIGSDGDVVGSGPYFGGGYDASAKSAAKLSPFRIRDGRFATAPHEVVIDAGSAKKAHLAVGDTVKIATTGPQRSFDVVGVITFGDVKSLGTASIAVFDLRAAQQLFGKRGAYDSILVAAKPGVSGAQLRARLASDLPAYKVQTAAKHDRFDLDGLKMFVKIIRIFLLAFGGVAIFVGAFTIVNTMSITVAQRSREFATLRTIGAARRQVLGSVLAEASAVGIAASAIGIGLGVAIAKGLQSVFTAAGMDLPQSGLVFASRTVIVSVLVGVVVTVLAGLVPAVRATRISPVAGLREGAEIPVTRAGRRLPTIATAITALGLAILFYALFGGGIRVEDRLLMLAPGVLLLFTGIALLSPRFARPLASVLGRPAARLGGAAGMLARGNSMRNPGRTAATAAALMIAIALVSFVAVLGHGLRASTTGSLEKEVRADYVIVGQDGWSNISPDSERAVRSVPGVTVASGIRQDEIKAFGEKANIDGVDPAIATVHRTEYKHGSDAVLSTLGTDGAVVTEDYADDHHLTVGERFSVTTSAGRTLGLQVRAISSPAKFNPLNLGAVTISNQAFDSAFRTRKERFSFIKVDGGANPATTAALKAKVASFPDAKLQTKDVFAKDQSAWVDQVLAILYVLLALAVVCSMFGMVNTLVLSIVERTRELGLLRAVGMTRRQARRMVRHESIITALIGTALGILVGMFLAGLVTMALSDSGLVFSVPTGSLIAFVVIAIVAGSIAALLPARRAARLNVLSALSYE